MEHYIWWLNHHAVKPENQISTRQYSIAKSLSKLGIKTIIITGTHDHNTTGVKGSLSLYLILFYGIRNQK